MKLFHFFIALIVLMAFSSCKKEKPEEEEKPETVDYRECYEGMFDVDYLLISHYDNGTVDTVAELFTGIISMHLDSSIVISGASFGDFMYKVETNGDLKAHCETAAGTITCDSLNSQYGMGGMICPPYFPLGWSGAYYITAVRQ